MKRLSYIDNELSKYGLDRNKYESILNDIELKLNKGSDLTWDDITSKYELDFSGESLRKAQQLPIFGGNFVKQYFEEMLGNDQSQYFDDIFIKIKEERSKLQTEKLEINRWIREKSRDDLLNEKIVDAIKDLEPLNPVAPKKDYNDIHNKTITEYVLFFGDAHYGIEFELYDVFGNIINSYSPDIFERRMNYLFDEVVKIIRSNDIKKLHIVDLGDNIDGLLRLTSQLMKLRYGVVESTIRYAEYISNWLNSLSNYVKIDFHMVMDGNHTQLRMCGAPKNAFPEENMTKVIQSFVVERLKRNDNVNVIVNPSGNVFFDVAGYNLLAIHGEVKDMRKALEEYGRIYNTHISYLVAGHYHSSKSEDIGPDCAVYNIPSVIGADSYSISLRRKSNAAAVLMEFTSGHGRTCECDIKLSDF